MQRLVLQFLFSALAAPLLQAQNSSSQIDFTRIAFTTISGPARNALVYAPNPVIHSQTLPRHLVAHGVFKMDLDNGIPYDVRVVQSTGYKELDEAAVATLRTWRFRPTDWFGQPFQIEFRVAEFGDQALT